MDKIVRMWKGRKTQSRYWKWLKQYSKPHIWKIIFLMFINLMNSSMGVFMTIVSKKIIDSATFAEDIFMLLVLYIGLMMILQGFSLTGSLVSVQLTERFSFGIRKQIYEKIINSHWMDVKKYHTGDLLTRLTTDAGNIASGIVEIIPNIVKLVLELILVFFTLHYYSPPLAFFALFLAPIAGVTSLWLGRRLKKLQIKVQESESAYRSFLQESLANLLIVKSFANENYAIDRFMKLRDERFYWVFKKNKLGLATSTSMSMTFQLGYIAAFAYGALQLSIQQITFGTMTVFLALVNRVQAPILQLADYVPKLVSVLASTGRISELQEIALEEKYSEHIDSTEMGVRVDAITFGYSDDIILKDISLSILPGEFVAIVGASGIGKTTLIRLIMSFMNNNEGTIEFVNGNGNTEKANAGTREFISYVPQGNTLFSGTIRENIRMGKLDATEAEMIEALKLAAGLEFVFDLPQGLDTIIGEMGHGLSEGQAQRIAIARALVRNAPFLILDEATSALDENTELEVLDGIAQLLPRPTCLLITHRKSVLQYCDREIKIENQVIVENRSSYNIAGEMLA